MAFSQMRGSRLRAHALALTVAAVGLLCSPHVLADPGRSATLVKAHEAASSGGWQHAASLFEREHAKFSTFETASNLGLAYLELGKRARAAHFLDAALRVFPEDGSAQLKALLTDRLEGLRSQFGRVVLGGIGRAAVTIDNEPQPYVNGTVGAPLYLTPGSHRLTIKVGDSDAIVREVVVQAKEDVRVSVGGQGSGSGGGARPVILIVGTTLAIGGATAGLAVLMSSFSRDGQADDKEAALAGASADPATEFPEATQEVADARDAASGLTVGAGVAIGVAGAFAVGTLIYAIASEGSGGGSADSAASVITDFRVTPVFSPVSSAGLPIGGLAAATTNRRGSEVGLVFSGRF